MHFHRNSLLLNDHVADGDSGNIQKENKYNTSVLVGNWFDDRFSDRTDRKAVVPSIYGQSSCIKDESLYKNDYKSCAFGAKSAKEFNEWRQRGFTNSLNSRESNVSLLDNEKYLKNMTTHTDVFFRIKPSEDSPKTILDMLKKKPKEDLLKSYGNATEFGLRRTRDCEQQREDNIPTGVSLYKQTFIQKQANVVRSLKKKPTNTI